MKFKITNKKTLSKSNILGSIHQILLTARIPKLLSLSRESIGYIHLPILFYHSIGNDKSAEAISTDSFKKQIAFLASHCDVIRLEDTYGIIKGQHKKGAKIKVAVTFDDGEKCIYNNAHPIMEKFKLPYTVFIPTAYIGKKSLWKEYPLDTLSKSDIISLKRTGLVSFGSHGVDHVKMTGLVKTRMENQAKSSRAELIDLLGDCKVDMFAYPYGGFGTFSRKTSTVLASSGYKIGLTTVTGVMQSKKSLLALYRTNFNEDDNERDMLAKLSGYYDWLIMKDWLRPFYRKLFKQII